MRLKTFLLSTVVLAMAASAEANAATTFWFQFDDSGGGPDGTIGTPIVGNGIFESPIDLTPGVYDLSSLPGFQVKFAVNGSTFSTADIKTPLDGVAVDITAVNAKEDRLVFKESGSADSDSGPLFGALDLINVNSDELSFEPASYGGNNLYFELPNGTSDRILGNYLALSGVPESSTWAMLALGFMGLACVVHRGSRPIAMIA